MRRRPSILLAVPVLLVAGLTAAPASSADAAPPHVTSISPSSGSTAARQHVTIHGTGFMQVRGVYFGHRKASSVWVLNPRTIVAYAPVQGRGTRHVTVRARAGTSRRVHADRYAYRRGDVLHTSLVPHLAPLPADAHGGHEYADESLGNWSCGRPAHCVAVGSYEAEDGKSHAIALVRHGRGTSTSRVPGIAASLTDVSCAGPQFCGATGLASDYAPVFATLIHGHWTIRRLPRADGSGTLPAHASVGGLSCAAGALCVFGGEGPNGGAGAIYTLSGNSLSVQPAPQPAGGSAHQNVELGEVSCPTTRWCVLIGRYTEKGSGEHTMAITLADGTPSATQIFGPHHSSDPGVTAVECPAVARCDGVGYYYDHGSSGRVHAELAVLDAHGWRALAVPDPVDVDDTSYLTGISCPAVAHCIAVGWYDARWHGHSSGQDGLIVSLQGDTVRTQNAPTPKSGPVLAPELLNAVSCSTTSSCVAVGGVSGGVLSETLTSAGVWVPAGLGRPRAGVSDSQASYRAVTCPTDATCLVSGTTLYDVDEGGTMSLQPLYSIGVKR